MVDEKYKSLGNITKWKEIERGISFTLNFGKGEIYIYSPSILRVRITAGEEFDLDESYAVIKRLNQWKKPNYKITESSTEIFVETDEIKVTIIKAPFGVKTEENKEDGQVLFEDLYDKGNGLGAFYYEREDGIGVGSFKRIEDSDHFYGFGEKTGSLDKRGERLVMDNHDMPYSHNADPLYQAHPYYINIRKGIAHAIFFDNISRTTFDMEKTYEGACYFKAESGDLNYYFIYGPGLDKVLERYTGLTGRMEMPPKWAIGYHQCRYSYKNEKQIKQITEKFRKHKIPCDVIWYDIHYMDGYRCFTFNKKRFPDPAGFNKVLDSKGFKTVTIVDPGIKVDENYRIYQELKENNYYTKREDGNMSKGYVWPGVTTFPDFTLNEVQDWWAEKHKFYFDRNLDGIWNDMNEPALSINPLFSWPLHVNDMYLDDHGRNTHISQCRNIYALCEAKATWKGFKKHKPNARPFILTRSGYAGVQRYAAIWTGDNWSNWFNINLANRMCLNLSLSGQSFVGEDIGGHMSIKKMLFKIRDEEMFIRWIQSGSFHPFCRVHTTKWTPSQDPFSYGDKAQKISQKYIEFRYALLPYWYTLFREYCESGKPIMRPLFYHSPDDEMCHHKRYENQFFLGRDMLIVPIGEPSCTEIEVYLPEDKWINYWTSKQYGGRKIHKIPVALNDIPVFIRKGAIIPMQEVLQYTDEKPIETIELRIFKGNVGVTRTLKLYEDDGVSMDYKKKNAFCNLDITCTFTDDGVDLSAELAGNFKPHWKKIQYTVMDKGHKVDEGIIQIEKKG